MKPGQAFLFSRPGVMPGRFIQHAQTRFADLEAAQWTHAMLGYCTDTLIGAEDLKGVQRVTLQHYYLDPAVTKIACYDVPGLDVQAALNQADALFGRPYATEDLFRVYLARALYIHGLDADEFDGVDRLICSEFLARACFAGGVDLRPDGIRSFGLVSPSDLAFKEVRGLLKKAWQWERPFAIA